MTDSSDEIQRLLASLKRTFKAAGIRYAHAASSLGVSEMTVKRWMAGRGLDLVTLQRLCGLADLTLTELAEIAKEDAEETIPFINAEQAAAMTGDIFLSTTFFLLTRGWNGDRISRELRISEAEMNGYLTRLDRLGVIALFPGNRIRLLRRMSIHVRDTRPMFELVARRASEFFADLDLTDPAIAWAHGIARLSPASFRQVSERLDRLSMEIFMLGERDLDLPADAVEWYTLFAGVRPVTLDELMYEGGKAP